MLKRIIIRFIWAGLLLVWVTAGTTLAQAPDKQSQFTFKRAVEVPGTMLPAGTYTFRLLEGPSRDLVQVMRDDGSTYAIFFARRHPQQPVPASKAELRFMETTPGVPPAVQTWWYPRERTGLEFVYPGTQLLRRADAAEPAAPAAPTLGSK
ncbi:MAG: hypothetical protein HYU37_01630 [Acidobacteria bacterium]|nr:hypothetical protein [Acidobacteriota bacterium]